ncbi:MAG TPA: putative glycoside hydrolase [Gaiellaceae bacterium]|nr:putative glycoside hydrolase [Gaiellaceae bacterium]
MLLEPLDPNERFRQRRRQSRKRRSLRRILVLGVVAVAAAVSALGMTFLNGWGGQTATIAGSASSPAATTTAPAEPEQAPLPDEIRGVHVTAALASLDGKLAEYLALADSGLTALQLDIKDENGEVGFDRGAPRLARAVGAARPFYNPRKAAQAAEDAGVYLIGRVVVFEDPVLATSRPQLAIQRRGGGVWTNSAGLAWTNPYNQRVWKYNVDIAVAAAEAGFDEIMFDYVRFPTDGDLSAAVFPGKSKGNKNDTIAGFLKYARSRLEPLGTRVSAAVFGLTATRDMGIGQRPRQLATHLDVIYPMVYPSHFGSGEYSLDDPNAVPGVTVARALRDFRRVLRGRDTLLVPWLQDFTLGREYSLEDVRAQILAARDAKARGFLLWNPSGVYKTKALGGP